MVIAVETTLTPLELLPHCHAVEQKHLRTREVRWGPRTLDVDIVTFGDARQRRPDADPAAPARRERAFVLYPWSLLEPAAELNGARVRVGRRGRRLRRHVPFDGYENLHGVATERWSSHEADQPPGACLSSAQPWGSSAGSPPLLTTRYRLHTPVLPSTALMTMGVIVVLTLVLGIRVLRWRNGKKKKMLNPILAAWTLVLAQACAYTGKCCWAGTPGSSWTSSGSGTCAATRASPGRPW